MSAAHKCTIGAVVRTLGAVAQRRIGKRLKVMGKRDGKGLASCVDGTLAGPLKWASSTSLNGQEIPWRS
ncbi:MAG: hypothetical protein ACREUE_08445 [Panacagrimonas sp.]